MGVESGEGGREEGDDKDTQLVGRKETETNVPTACLQPSTIVVTSRTKPSRILHIEAYESTDEEDDKVLADGKDVETKTPTVTHVELVDERPESPLKRKRLE